MLTSLPLLVQGGLRRLHAALKVEALNHSLALRKLFYRDA